MDKLGYLTQLLSKADIEVNGNRSWDIRIKDPKAVELIFKNPSLGAGESYMAGYWEADRLDEFFFRILRGFDYKELYHFTTLFKFWLKSFLINLQSPRFSKKVAEKHYNIDNELYAAMLGPSMAYTCGYWRNATDLDQAQYHKYDLICRKLQLRPGEKVLELGCGFGGFAKYAAEKFGVSMISINISSEQMKYARQICKDLPIQLVECDYRDVKTYNPKRIKFDKIVSIGLCEHIGYDNYRNFFNIASDNLKENGLFLLHTIAKNLSTRFADPWIQKYIFPNGMLPTLKILSDIAEPFFVTEDVHNISADYDKTLMSWNENFVKAWPRLSPRHDQEFYRMWQYYLLSCAGGFRARSMQLYQFVFSPKGEIYGYHSCR